MFCEFYYLLLAGLSCFKTNERQNVLTQVHNYHNRSGRSHGQKLVDN